MTYAPYEPDSVTEPMCCGDPMVSNSWAQRWECASAFFALIDEGVLEDFMERLAPDDCPPGLVETWAHWRASWVAKELVWCAAQRAGIDYHQLPEDRGPNGSLTGCGRLVEWIVGRLQPRRGWVGLRTELVRASPCPRCWPNGDLNALGQQ